MVPQSPQQLGEDQIDLPIQQQPLPSWFGRTWSETLVLADGKGRAIGVSNFMVERLTNFSTARR